METYEQTGTRTVCFEMLRVPMCGSESIGVRVLVTTAHTTFNTKEGRVYEMRFIAAKPRFTVHAEVWREALSDILTHELSFACSACGCNCSSGAINEIKELR
jgi:hypothetical protein